MEYETPKSNPIKTITVRIEKLETVLRYLKKGAPEIAKKYLKEILNEQISETQQKLDKMLKQLSELHQSDE